MKLLLQILAGLALAVALLVVLVLSVDPFPRQHEFTARFTKFIHEGMARPEVEGILGPPHSESATFHLAQREGFEKQYECAARSGSSYYLFWETGDFVWAVGFNHQERVVLVAFGGT